MNEVSEGDDREPLLRKIGIVRLDIVMKAAQAKEMAGMRRVMMMMRDRMNQG